MKLLWNQSSENIQNAFLCEPSVAKKIKHIANAVYQGEAAAMEALEALNHAIWRGRILTAQNRYAYIEHGYPDEPTIIADLQHSGRDRMSYFRQGSLYIGYPEEIEG